MQAAGVPDDGGETVGVVDTEKRGFPVGTAPSEARPTTTTLPGDVGGLTATRSFGNLPG